HVALAGGGAASEARGPDVVAAGGRAGPGAMVGGVVVASPAVRGARAVCRRGLQDIGRAGARAAGAAFGHVALAGGGAADGAAGFEDVHAGGRAGPGAVVGGVVVASPALRGARAVCRRGLEDIGRAAARAAGAAEGRVGRDGWSGAGRAAGLE